MPMTNLSEAKVKDFNDIVIAQVDTKIFLLNKPSGTFSFFDKNLKIGDFTLFDPSQLDKVAIKKLLVCPKWPPVPPKPDPETR
jgi:hypothetical protein